MFLQFLCFLILDTFTRLFSYIRAMSLSKIIQPGQPHLFVSLYANKTKLHSINIILFAKRKVRSRLFIFLKKNPKNPAQNVFHYSEAI